VVLRHLLVELKKHWTLSTSELSACRRPNECATWPGHKLLCPVLRRSFDDTGILGLPVEIYSIGILRSVVDHSVVRWRSGENYIGKGQQGTVGMYVCMYTHNIHMWHNGLEPLAHRECRLLYSLCAQWRIIHRHRASCPSMSTDASPSKLLAGASEAATSIINAWWGAVGDIVPTTLCHVNGDSCLFVELLTRHPDQITQDPKAILRFWTAGMGVSIERGRGTLHGWRNCCFRVCCMPLSWSHLSGPWYVAAVYKWTSSLGREWDTSTGAAYHQPLVLHVATSLHAARRAANWHAP